MGSKNRTGTQEMDRSEILLRNMMGWKKLQEHNKSAFQMLAERTVRMPNFGK
jgi:hypothetical protein